MAEDDMPDLDHDGLDWFYLEDDFPLADELAESQIPDPGYAGTQYELDMFDSYDFDLFDYWDDLHYGDDSYWDHAAGGTGQKRKRDPHAAHRATEKRRKVISLKDTSGDDVIFVDSVFRRTLSRSNAPVVQSGSSYGLFPDWRKRFAGEDGIEAVKEMPADMKIAAEVQHRTPEKRSPARVAFVSAEGEIVGDGEDQEEAGLQAELASLDADTLKSILRERLGDAGLEGMNEDVFMTAITKMLSGAEGEGDIAGTLADDLLNQATEGNDTAIAGWLSQQGVSLNEAEDEEDEDAANEAVRVPRRLHAVATAQNVQSSPSDSVIDTSATANGITSTSELAIHTSSPTSAKKKRPAPSTQSQSLDEPKAKKIALEPDEKTVTMLSPTSKDDGREADQHFGDHTTLVPAEVNAKAVAANRKKHAPKTAQETTSNVHEQKEDAGPTKSAPPRQTRKRKAEPADGEPETRGAKKQAKQATGPAQAAGRRTRSTRSTTKASS